LLNTLSKNLSSDSKNKKHSNNHSIKSKLKKFIIKKYPKIYTINNIVHIMLIHRVLIKEDFLIMVNYMEQLGHLVKDGYGILKILMILKILPKKLLNLKPK